jgi:hypothetical protein
MLLVIDDCRGGSQAWPTNGEVAESGVFEG